MAGSIVISSVQLDSDNNFSILSNTGATLVSANGSGLNVSSSLANNSITSDKIVSVANTKIAGTISATQLAANSVNASILQTNSVENYMATSGRPLTNRNLIINGAMQVAQRNTSVTGITTSDYYTADRWFLNMSSAGTWTMNVESSAPTGTEFRNSANVICTTADSSLSASDRLLFAQRIEGQNLQGLKKGTANAESLTVSFYVKSSNTGTYICEFLDTDNSRQISKSYTINAANTWEKKTITFPPDTTGQLDNDNANSLSLVFWLAAGTDFTSGALNSSAWASTVNANRAVGQLNLANATGNYWAVTGVQLETGTVATPYEWLDYGTELLKCQRYYEQDTCSLFAGTRFFQGSPSAVSTANLFYKTPKRSAPTTTIVYNGSIDNANNATIGTTTKPTNCTVDVTISAGGLSNYPYATADITYKASCEL